MVQPRLTGLDYQKLLSWYGFHEEHGLRNSSKVFHFFKTVIKVFKAFKVFAPYLKNEAVNQLMKANFINWKATRVSLTYTHRLAVCEHLEKHLPPSLWTTVSQTIVPQLSKCLKFEAIWGVLTDQKI